MSADLLPSIFIGLPTAHQDEIIKIRTSLRNWLQGFSDDMMNISGARERFAAATQEFTGLTIASEYAFTPSPPYKYQRILLSCVRCYWMAIVLSMDVLKRDDLAVFVNDIAPYGDTIPKFDGLRCVQKPGDLTAKEYTGLMQTAMFAIVNLVDSDVLDLWRELGDVGVRSWEGRS